MSFPEITPDSVQSAIETLVEKGMLSNVGHGFCWTCQTEKSVYDVSAEHFPSQEPKCADCIINAAMIALKFVDIQEKVFGDYGNVNESIEGT
jgi:hypothetical protein